MGTSTLALLWAQHLRREQSGICLPSLGSAAETHSPWMPLFPTLPRLPPRQQPNSSSHLSVSGSPPRTRYDRLAAPGHEAYPSGSHSWCCLLNDCENADWPRSPTPGGVFKPMSPQGLSKTHEAHVWADGWVVGILQVSKPYLKGGYQIPRTPPKLLTQQLQLTPGGLGTDVQLRLWRCGEYLVCCICPQSGHEPQRVPCPSTERIQGSWGGLGYSCRWLASRSGCQRHLLVR